MGSQMPVPEISEEIVAISSFFTCLLCLYTFVKTKELQSLSWAAVALFLALTYTWIAIYNPTEFDKKWLVRIDIMVLLFTIVYWHINYMVCLRRNGKGKL